MYHLPGERMIVTTVLVNGTMRAASRARFLRHGPTATSGLVIYVSYYFMFLLYFAFQTCKLTSYS